MNKEIFDKLSRIENTILEMDTLVKGINDNLEALIAALRNYDDGVEMFNDEPQGGPCTKHDEASWDEERMNIIGQNGNEGTHYDNEYEYDDYGKKIDVNWIKSLKPQYDKLLKSGMFFEFHPTWTGEWEKDQYAFAWEVKYNKLKIK